MEQQATLRDSLSENWDKSLAEAVENAPDTVVETVVEAKPDPVEVTEKVESEPVKAEKTETDKVESGLDKTNPTTAEIKAVADAGIRPPSSWSPAAKAKWASIDPDIQKEVDKRESDFHKGLEEYKPYKTKWSTFEQTIQPYMATIQSMGIDPIQAVQGLMAADHRLRYAPAHEKANYLRMLANQYGVDANMLYQEQPQVDPQFAALQQELAQLRGTITQGQAAQQQAMQQEVGSEIQNFQSDPKNIYFNDVKVHMSALLDKGLAKDLPDAYEQACRANPAVWSAMSQQTRAEEEKKRISEAQKKAADAKRAGFDVQGKGAVSGGQSKKTLRESLEEAYDASNS